MTCDKPINSETRMSVEHLEECTNKAYKYMTRISKYSALRLTSAAEEQLYNTLRVICAAVEELVKRERDREDTQ